MTPRVSMALAVGLLFRERHNSDAVPMRIVWTGRGARYTYYITTIAPEWPVPILTEVLEQRLAPDYEGDDALDPVMDTWEPWKRVAVSAEAEARYGWLEPLVANADIHFRLMSASERGRLLTARAAEVETSYQTLTTWLRRYWAGGLTKAALETGSAPPTKEAKPRNPQSMSGPKPSKSAGGIPLNAESTFWMQTAATLWLANRKLSYQSVLDHVFNMLGLSLPKFFSVRQFSSYLGKNYPYSVRKRARTSAREFNLSHRDFIGRSETYGPGALYQIDATVGDIYLVSILDRNRLVGRPTIYLLSDVFSRLIVGVYVGFEPPSYYGAALAFQNAVTSKVAFCAEYGIEIVESEWPSHHMCAAIQGDGASDVTTQSWNFLVSMLGLSMGNTAPYRPDWKAIIESRFNLLTCIWKEYAPGYVEKDFTKRGGHDYRLDGALTLPEFIAVLISAILEYNNRPLRTRLQTPEMVRQKIHPTPAEWWNLGVKLGLGSLRLVDPDTLGAAMYPRIEVPVGHRGIEFADGFWTTPRAVREEWFVRARQKKSKAVIGFDPGNLKNVYVHYSDGTWERAVRRETGPEIEPGLTYSEYQQHSEAAKINLGEALAAFRSVARKGRAQRDKIIQEALAETAKARQAAGTQKPDTKNIRANQADERELHRQVRAGEGPAIQTPEDAVASVRPQEEGFFQKRDVGAVTVEVLRQLKKNRRQGEENE